MRERRGKGMEHRYRIGEIVELKKQQFQDKIKECQKNYTKPGGRLIKHIQKKIYFFEFF